MTSIESLFNRFLLTIFIAGFILVNPVEANEKLSNSTFRLLFIGNSLTYTNRLPKLVERTAARLNLDVETKMIAKANYALMDHWDKGRIQKELAKGVYDFIIIQQGPSSQPLGRQVLIDYGKKIADLASSHGTKLAYFMVWPSVNYFHTFEGVIINHRNAAKLNQAILLPVGEVWKRHFNQTGSYEYYSRDGFHPSLAGSKVAAEVIVENLFKAYLPNQD